MEGTLGASGPASEAQDMATTPQKVNFPFEAALPAAAALWHVAATLYQDVEPARQQAASTAMDGFKGTFAQQFIARMKTSAGNATTVADDLRAAAQNIAKAWADAQHQQQLYNYFAMVKDKRDNKSLIQEAGDWLTGDDTNYGKQPDPPAVPSSPAFAPTTVPQASVPGETVAS